MSTNKVAVLLERNIGHSKTYKAPRPLLEGILKRASTGTGGTVIISCSDPRITPEQYLGLSFGEAAIIRNAGGRTQDAIRSILALDAVGMTGDIIVVHHTDCGMSHNTEEGFREKTEARHAGFLESHAGFVFGAIDDPEKTVVEDVDFLKSYPSLVEHFAISGLVLDTFTGVLKQMV